MTDLDQTHDSARRSWEESANRAGTDFPIQNLPFGIFQRAGELPRGGIALGDFIIDLPAVLNAGLLPTAAAEAASACTGPTLNALLERGRAPARALRQALSELFTASGAAGERARALRDRILVPLSAAQLKLPVAIGGFTDFLCSVDHTLRMGRGNLPPSFQHLPIAYNSRASSVRVSGEEVVRPNGIWRLDGEDVRFGPEPWLDFELELGALVAGTNDLGRPVGIDEAPERLFGYCLLNDWSARRIQFFESTPLGPFLGKSLSTTISPWIVTADALAPFRVPSRPRTEDESRPLPHLRSTANSQEGGLGLVMEASIATPAMQARGTPDHLLTTADFRHIYWTFAQMLTHHASNGCNLRAGDLFGSGTVSGPTDDSRACLAEINARGTAPISLPGGEQRTWLDDGDEIVFRAHAVRDGFVTLGFGECRGRVAPSPR